MSKPEFTLELHQRVLEKLHSQALLLGDRATTPDMTMGEAVAILRELERLQIENSRLSDKVNTISAEVWDDGYEAGEYNTVHAAIIEAGLRTQETNPYKEQDS